MASLYSNHHINRFSHSEVRTSNRQAFNEDRLSSIRTSINDRDINLNALSFEQSVIRRYNEGSVYRQASRFNPYVSSSTNISSSLSGSVELIVSDLDERIDSQSKNDLSPLNETSNENSDDPDTVFIQNLAFQKRKLSTAMRNEGIETTILQLQTIQQNEKMNKEKSLYRLRLQILKAFNNT